MSAATRAQVDSRSTCTHCGAVAGRGRWLASLLTHALTKLRPLGADPEPAETHRRSRFGGALRSPARLGDVPFQCVGEFASGSDPELSSTGDAGLPEVLEDAYHGLADCIGAMLAEMVAKWEQLREGIVATDRVLTDEAKQCGRETGFLRSGID